MTEFAKRVVLPLVFVFALASCSGPRLLVYFSEPYWSAVASPQFSEEMSAVARRHNLEMRVANPQITEGVEADLNGELAKGNVRVVVVDPFLSPNVGDVAAGHDSILFILLGQTAQPARNVAVLQFDRLDAFRVEGEAVAALLRDESTGSVTAAAPLKVAVLVPAPATPTDPAVAAFTAGLSESDKKDKPFVKEIQRPVDRATVVAATQDLRSRGYEVLFPRLGELNGACLETLAASGGFVVTEDWQASRAYPAQVLMSVEEDIAGGVDACLTAGQKQGQVVSGPVRVVAGGARKIPAGFEGKIEGP